MSWVISSGDDNWYYDDDEVKKIQERRRQEIEERANIAPTLDKMVNGDASSMDGKTKASRRIWRYAKMCTDSGEKPIESGIANPYGGSIPPGVGWNREGLEKFTERAASKLVKEKAKRAANETAERVMSWNSARPRDGVHSLAYSGEGFR